ncbi:23074_t:CDS:2, partial [Racocetra persica]
MKNYSLIVNKSSPTDSFKNLNVEDDSSENLNVEVDNAENLNVENDHEEQPKDSPKNTSHHLPPVHIELYCEKTFETWDECQKVLEHYARQNNFVIRKKHVDNSNDPYQQTWDCERSGKYTPRKTALPEKQRKKAFATEYWKLTTKMKKLIESYTLCDIDILSQVKLFRGLFSEATIVDYDVKNYVYKFHRNHKIEGGDATKLLHILKKSMPKILIDIVLNDNTTLTNTYNLLLSIFAVVDNNFKSRIIAQAVFPDETSESYRWVLQQTIEATRVQPGTLIIDADPGLESVVPKVYPNTYLLHCVWHIEHNLEKQLSKLLGDYYTDFLKAFYHTQNVLCKEAFERYWKQLMIDFPESTKYLLSKKVDLDNLYNLTLGTVENEPIEIEYDLHQIYFEKLLKEIDHLLIAEVWEVHSIENKSSIRQHVVLLKNGFYLCHFYISLIPNCWYKDNIVDALVGNELFVKSNEYEDSALNTPTAAKAIGQKQSTKGSLLVLHANLQSTKDDQASEYEQVNNEVLEYDQVLEETKSDQVIEHAQASHLE